MSKKSELINLLEKYQGSFNVLKANIEKYNADPMVSEIGKAEIVNQSIEKLKPIAQDYNERINGVISQSLTSIAMSRNSNSAGKLTDSGYQIGLANVLKMIELGAIATSEDMQNIIAVYANDVNAISAISQVLKSKGCSSDFMGIIPHDNIEKVRHMIDVVKNKVDIIINPNHINSGTFSSSAKKWNSFNGNVNINSEIDAICNYIDSNFADDLTLVTEDVTNG